MFTSKEEFKNELISRTLNKYGKELNEVPNEYLFMIIGTMIREYAMKNWLISDELIKKNQSKRLYYFSMEFLIGILFTNNAMNLGVYDVIKNSLEDLNIDINEIEDVESDAGLGNGGLGRLAACFLDSIASLNLPGNGNCIRYKYGLFKQKIVNNEQQEVPDTWLSIGNVWEIKKVEHAIDVKFYGHVEMKSDDNGHMKFIHKDAECVRAVPYDVPIVGYNTTQTNFLRLWDAEVSSNIPVTTNFIKYVQDVNLICQNVYPDDSTKEGRIIRLKQEYFFVAAGLNTIIKTHLKNYDNLDNFHEKVVIQLNDTHPVLCIPELMRILIDEYDYSWEKAWVITTNTFAYTNHTILQEAIERWPVSYIQSLLPRLYMIIAEIDNRYKSLAYDFFDGNYSIISHTEIIKDNVVHMGNLAIIGSFSVNGVAYMHSEILKNNLFNEFYRLWPNKFSNKTNGITHRRWLLFSNPQLTNLIKSKIGDNFICNPQNLDKLLEYKDDKDLLDKFLIVKKERKQILANYIKKELNIDISVDSIFDIQAKRLHAYKRQLLNILHVIYLYQKILNDNSFSMHPQTFIFAAKAAPAYILAKKIIKLINCVANKINNDPVANKFIKVIFIPNYSVSIAELLMSAADISEQISTAGKEASGTGNMKFMLNGAITLGTMDGANVEIDELVTSENDIIFGLNEKEVIHCKKSYSSLDIYSNNHDLRNAIDTLINGTFSNDPEDFRVIYDDLILRNDEYLVLKDFESYCEAHRKAQSKYIDRYSWAKSCIINIGKAGYFSSDRTILEYKNDIWKI